MSRVKLPPAQSVTGGFINGARITAITDVITGDPAVGYTTATGSTQVTYPLVSGAEGEFAAYFPPSVYDITFNSADDTHNNPERWDAATGWLSDQHLVNFEVGRNPSADLYPTDPSKWWALTFKVVQDREGGDRVHLRSMNVASLDKPEIVIRTFGPNNTAPFGPNQDATDLEGVVEGGGLGRVTWQPRPGGTDNAGPHAARITATSAETVRADSLSTTLAVAATLPTDRTLVVNGNVGAITATDGTTQSWRDVGVARIGSSRTTYAGWKYDSGSNRTTLYGCTGGGIVTATLVTAFADADANVRFRSRLVGSAGNAITVRYVDPGAANQAISIGVVGNAITVNLATDSTGAITTTGNDVVNAIRDSQSASNLVEMSRKNVGNGTAVVSAMAVTSLSGGADTTSFSVGQQVRSVVNKAGGGIDLHTSTRGYDDVATRMRMHSDGTVSIGRDAHESPQAVYYFLGGAMRVASMTTPVVTAEVIKDNTGTYTATATYKVIARTPFGGVSLPGSVNVTGVPTVLNATNYIRLSWPKVKGAFAYDIARTASSGLTPNTTGLIINQQPAAGVDPVCVDYGRALASVNEVQTVALQNADSGTFTLVFDGQETAEMAPFETAASVQAKVEALSTIGAGNVTVEKVGDSAWRFTFGGTLAATNVNAFTVGSNDLVPEDEVIDDPEDVPEPATISIRERVRGGPVSWTEPTRNTSGDLAVDGQITSEGKTVATQEYADTLAQGIKWKETVRVATTANISLSNQQTIDGVAVVANDRVLVKNQTTQSQNGIYLCKAGTAWTRTTDADTGTELEAATVAVASGTTNGNTTWRQTATGITLGTTAITWTELAGITTAGAGLTRSGNTVDVGAGSGILVAADSVAVDTSVVAPVIVSGTHASRPAAGTAGRQYFETDTHVLYLDTGSAWQAITPGYVTKTANETVNNSTTLQDDDHLFWPVEVGEQWAFDVLLRLTGASTNADWKFGWRTDTATLTMTWGIQSAQADFAPGSLAAVPVGTTPSVLLGAASTLSVGGLANSHLVRLVGTVSVTGAAGTIYFQWAQNTATAENSTVASRSWMNLRRLV